MTHLQILLYPAQALLMRSKSSRSSSAPVRNPSRDLRKSPARYEDVARVVMRIDNDDVDVIPVAVRVAVARHAVDDAVARAHEVHVAAA